MKKSLLAASLFCFGAASSYGHTINYDLAELSTTDIIGNYFRLGFTHILPLGLDHILFVLSIFFLSNRLKPILWQATAFTLAHSITLGLAMYGYIQPLPAIIEPLIALSIFFVAVENMLTRELRPGRIGVVFLFGLVHGMGFAGALSELGLPPSDFWPALLSFNLGVELGQIAVILLAFGTTAYWFAQKNWYRGRVVQPISAVIALVALYWTLERTFG